MSNELAELYTLNLELAKRGYWGDMGIDKPEVIARTATNKVANTLEAIGYAKNALKKIKEGQK